MQGSQFGKIISATGILLLAMSWPVGADEAARLEFFEKKIRPVLVEHCYKCHSAEVKKPKGNLTLDTRAGIRRGGDSGPAVVPGKPQESWLIKAVRHTREDLKMPPAGKLPDPVVADLEAWVKMGAPDPRGAKAGPAVNLTWQEMLKNRRQWWSLQPVHKTTPPAGRSPHPVDRFMHHRLEKAGLVAGPAADRPTLIRRLSLVLTGLLPTPAEVEAFVADQSPRAYEKLVDRLLTSPHFGERWARHWMDVVRYAETHGNEWNYEVHHAWRYRDYLIRAFNEDVPYDQLVREHLAGDMLSPPRWNRAGQFNESVIGTAFYRFGEVNHDDCIEFRALGYDLLDNQIDTLGKAFQATTVACARCHDHKIDAVSMKDYYAVLGILRSSRQVSHTIDAPEANAKPKALLRQIKVDLHRELARLWSQEARDLGRYLLAAQAQLHKHGSAADLAKGLDPKRLETWRTLLKEEKKTLEDPLFPWLTLRGAKDFPAAWKSLGERYRKEDQARHEFNARHFVAFGDFGKGRDGWQNSGQGLSDGPVKSGDFAVACAGAAAVSGIFPAGFFSHALSDKLNGALRSPLLPAGKKYLSFHVLGGKTSAVRIVSNSCQFNYVNYKALTKNAWEWKKFTIPQDREELRPYAEVMTKFDNPKFPDQLGTLGGDTLNYRVPWEEAAADPRSFFGITRVVVHDVEETPRPELGHLRSLLAGPVGDLSQLAEHYSRTAAAVVKAWADGKAGDDDVRWLDWLVNRGILSNSRQATAKLNALLDQYRAAEKQLALPRIIPGMADFDGGFEQPVLARGDFRKPGEPVARGYLEVLSKSAFTPRGSGRLELALRLASPDNPLTARVMVNRIWHHVFGHGIVRTVDDFGRVGEVPSHPELLDYLAARFVEEGWSIKKLIRALVLTQTFQRTSRATPEGVKVDPENRLLHHFPARRMEAEAIRDALLTASGRLDRPLYGLSIHPYRDKANADRRLFPGPLDGHGRRSLYIKVTLMEGPKFLGAFNLPGGKVTQGRRDVTNVPAQALALLNDPFVHQQAKVWADRLVARPDASAGARIAHMFQVALGRQPTPPEKDRFTHAVRELAELHEVPPERILTSPVVWKDLAHAIFNLKEFIYIR